MANVSYCRFQNTYHDYLDCCDAIEHRNHGINISHDEEKALRRMLRASFELLRDEEIIDENTEYDYEMVDSLINEIKEYAESLLKQFEEDE